LLASICEFKQAVLGMQVISVSASDRRSPRWMVRDRLDNRSEAGNLPALSRPRRLQAALLEWVAAVVCVSACKILVL
jgi:hypothetical protein